MPRPPPKKNCWHRITNSVNEAFHVCYMLRTHTHMCIKKITWVPESPSHLGHSDTQMMVSTIKIWSLEGIEPHLSHATQIEISLWRCWFQQCSSRNHAGTMFFALFVLKKKFQSTYSAPWFRNGYGWPYNVTPNFYPCPGKFSRQTPGASRNLYKGFYSISVMDKALCYRHGSLLGPTVACWTTDRKAPGLNTSSGDLCLECVSPMSLIAQEAFGPDQPEMCIKVA
jgi:hypothetical protein